MIQAEAVEIKDSKTGNEIVGGWIQRESIGEEGEYRYWFRPAVVRLSCQQMMRIAWRIDELNKELKNG